LINTKYCHRSEHDRRQHAHRGVAQAVAVLGRGAAKPANELRETNQRLEQQAKSLRASEELLKNQQEQLQQTNTELEERSELLALQNQEVERRIGRLNRLDGLWRRKPSN